MHLMSDGRYSRRTQFSLEQQFQEQTAQPPAAEVSSLLQRGERSASRASNHRHRCVSRSSSSESLLSEDLSVRARSLFFTLDKDGSGFIEQTELAECCGELNPVELDDLFEKLDHDGDGRISIKDFKEGFRQISQTLLRHRRKSRMLSIGSLSPSNSTDKDADGTTASLDSGERSSAIHQTRQQLFSRSMSEDHQDTINHYLQNLNDGLAALSCQEQVCEMYRIMHGEYPQLVPQFEAIILDFVRDVRCHLAEQERLEKTLHREKELHVSHLSQLEEEMESHMKKIEGKIREEVSERMENEYHDILENKKRDVEELTERIRKIQEASDAVEGEESVCALKTALASVQHENRCLKSEMTEAETRLTLTYGELKSLRQDIIEKSSELHRNKQLIVDYMKEQDKLQHQLSLLRCEKPSRYVAAVAWDMLSEPDANRKLHDQNDDLRSAVEDYSYRSAGSAPGRVSRQTSSLSRSSEATLSVCDPVFTKRDPLLPAHDTCEVDSLPDDLDSGLSTMRDVTEVDSELDMVMAQRASINQVMPHVRPQQLKTISSDSDYEPKESEFETEVERRAKLRLHKEVDDSDFLSADCTLRPESIQECSDSGREAGSGGGHRRSPSRRAPQRRSGRARQRPLQLRYKQRITPQVDIAPSPTGAPERMFKVVLCGDAAVGKSSFIMRLCKGKFVANMTSTLGVDFHPKTIAVDGRIFSLQLWDTAGQERFRSLAKNYFRKVDGVLLLYDCTYERSFINVRDWMCTVQEEAEKDIPVMIVGNKTDLREEKIAEGRKVITEQDGKRLAQEYEALFIETSAKSGEHTLESVTELARLMCTQQDLQVKSANVRLTAEKPKSSTNCCNM